MSTPPPPRTDPHPLQSATPYPMHPTPLPTPTPTHHQAGHTAPAGQQPLPSHYLRLFDHGQ